MRSHQKTRMSLPVVEEGETSENPTQSIHNIVMNTEEAVNEVSIRQRFIRSFPRYGHPEAHRAFGRDIKYTIKLNTIIYRTL